MTTVIILYKLEISQRCVSERWIWALFSVVERIPKSAVSWSITGTVITDVVFEAI